MENLPILVLKKIFYELDSLNEMIRCSWVCRNWRAAYEVCKPTTLCLHSKAFKLLNYRLAYSTERARRCQFFKISWDLQFLASEITSTHFANIRKLIIFSPNRFDYGFLPYHPFSFGKQLNHFKKLEHLEIQKGICIDLEDSELDLPMLKVLCFNAMRKKKYLNNDEYNEELRQEVLLNTPSLEVFEVQPYAGPSYFSEFVFKCPHQLRSLTAILMTGDFDPKTKFEQLVCLAVRGIYEEFRENLFSFFPNLKLLFINRYEPEEQLIEQKKRYGLDDLEILINNTEDRDYTLEHENWRKYVRHEKTVQYCPIELSVDFDQAIEHAVPLIYFKSFFRLNILRVGRVADQSLLIDLLRIVRTFYTLHLTPEFNLGVDFFSQIAGFLTVHRLHFPENILNRLNDYTFLEMFNFSIFSFKFENLPCEAVSVVLKKPNCQIDFQFDMESLEGQIEENEEEPMLLFNFSHFIQRHPALGFVCRYCDWASVRDSYASDPIKAVIKHVEYHWIPGDPTPIQNVTWEEYASL